MLCDRHCARNWRLGAWGAPGILPSDLVAYSLFHKRDKDMDLWMQFKDINDVLGGVPWKQSLK